MAGPLPPDTLDRYRRCFSMGTEGDVGLLLAPNPNGSRVNVYEVMHAVAALRNHPSPGRRLLVVQDQTRNGHDKLPDNVALALLALEPPLALVLPTHSAGANEAAYWSPVEESGVTEVVLQVSSLAPCMSGKINSKNIKIRTQAHSMSVSFSHLIELMDRVTASHVVAPHPTVLVGFRRIC